MRPGALLHLPPPGPHPALLLSKSFVIFRPVRKYFIKTFDVLHIVVMLCYLRLKPATFCAMEIRYFSKK
jgi:hypothetical protein